MGQSGRPFWYYCFSGVRKPIRSLPALAADPEMHRFTAVSFNRFKAFESFRLDLRHFNVLVGPNNAGKSTILAAFRILAAAMRRATSKNPTIVKGPQGKTVGWEVDLRSISVAEENIFFNYDDSRPASVEFTLSNNDKTTLFFSEPQTCVLITEVRGKEIFNTKSFKQYFDSPIGFVPILGPVEHHEPLYQAEAARLALFNYRAARNFRNIWYHYPDSFGEFRTALQQTWPGMDIQPPEIDRSHDKPVLFMFCPERRIPRELFWAGFGFQVWCQMLTHVIQSKNVSLFLIDEPDIYLHSDLQRQLLGLLRNLGPDILIATHSTEIVTEAETDDIVIVDKKRKSAQRIRDPSQLREVSAVLGSNLNVVLTQLAKTPRVLFTEGKDFQIIGNFARKLNEASVALRRDFAVVPVDGLNPDRMRYLKSGIEKTLDGKIIAAAILDRDYRSDDECDAISSACKDFCNYTQVHRRKEIENYLLVPTAVDRALRKRIVEYARRSGGQSAYEPFAETLLDTFYNSNKALVESRYIACRRSFERKLASQMDEASMSKLAVDEFEARWLSAGGPLGLVPGKEALTAVNNHAEDNYGVSVTPTGIIDAMQLNEVPEEMLELTKLLAKFSRESPET